MRSSSQPDVLTSCCACPRLAEFLADVRAKFPTYHGRPVVPFGDPQARLLVVGLAPGLHGANRTGRPFTGDHAGILLYQTLHRFGFATRAESLAAEDGLKLNDCRISNAVKCLPPQNKPEPSEVRTCNAYLVDELRDSPEIRVILALGGVAHKGVLMALGLKLSSFPFQHGACHALPLDARPALVLIDSYHCSRYNTQTRRLTAESFAAVFTTVRAELERLG